MRILVCTILAIGMVWFAAPARAQTYDPGFPVCLQTYGINGGYIDCSYSTLAQCASVGVGPCGPMLEQPVFRIWIQSTATPCPLTGREGPDLRISNDFRDIRS